MEKLRNQDASRRVCTTKGNLSQVKPTALRGHQWEECSVRRTQDVMTEHTTASH